MSTKHLNDEQIAVCAEAINNDCMSELPAEIRLHLKQCDACAQSVFMVSEISHKTVLQNPVIPLSNTKYNKRWLAVAAAITILAVSGFYLRSALKAPDSIIADQIVNAPHELNDSITVSLSQKTPVFNTEKDEEPLEITKNKTFEHNPQINTDKELLAYAPNIQLDKLADRFKDGNLRGGNIEIITKTQITGKSEALILEWKNDSNQKLIVEIFNNKGVRLFEKTTTSSSFNLKQLKTPGLYYWKLINDDFDLLFCGKIKTL